MHRLLTISFIILALAIGAAGAAPAAYAQEGTGAEWDNCDDVSNKCGSGLTCINQQCIADVPAVTKGCTTDVQCGDGKMCNTGNGQCVDTSAEPDIGTATTTTKRQVTNPNTTPPAGANNPTTLPAYADTTGAFGDVLNFLMKIFAWLLGIAAITLDNAVYYTVITMGDYISKLSAIGIAWRILRDLANIALIFGFLAIGITTILNVDWYGGGTKLLPKLLIAAVLLNFSLFITEAVIDTGNLFATQFYTQINGGQAAGAKGLSDITTEGISTKIMSQLGLATLYGNALSNNDVLKPNNSLLIGFMGIILFLVAAFVMFSLAFILIARFVILIFLIISAPIGFAGYAIPQLSGLAKKWRDKLIEQTITAPVLLLLLYIALTVITDENFLSFGAKADWTGFVNNANLVGFASTILSFLVAMGLLLAVVIFSKSLSAFGAGWATKMGGKLSFGATAWAGRSTGGWLANKGANLARKTWVGRVPLAGTGLVKGLNRIATSSFDVRSTSALKQLPFGGVDAGSAQKGGYKADLKSRIESRTKYAAELRGAEFTKEDRELINKAKKDREGAENSYKEIQEKQKNAAQEQEKLKAELAQLVEETKDIPAWEMGVETSQKMENLRQDIAKNEPTLTELGKTLEKEKKNLEVKTKEASEEGLAEQLGKNQGTRTKEAQRSYAKNLELGFDEHSWFNRYINFTANTDAAKKIRSEAKKSKTTKDVEKFFKTIEDSEKKESGGGEKKEEKEEKPKEAVT